MLYVSHRPAPMLMSGLRPGLLKMKIASAEMAPMQIIIHFVVSDGNSSNIHTAAAISPPTTSSTQPQMEMVSPIPKRLV